MELGTACAEYKDRTLRNLPCKRIQTDEIPSFVGSKEKHTTPEKKAQGWGDCWVWAGMCADTRLAVSWLAGGRDAGYAHEFMQDLAPRLANRVRLTTAAIMLTSPLLPTRLKTTLTMRCSLSGTGRQWKGRERPADIALLKLLE